MRSGYIADTDGKLLFTEDVAFARFGGRIRRKYVVTRIPDTPTMGWAFVDQLPALVGRVRNG